MQQRLYKSSTLSLLFFGLVATHCGGQEERSTAQQRMSEQLLGEISKLKTTNEEGQRRMLEQLSGEISKLKTTNEEGQRRMLARGTSPLHQSEADAALCGAYRKMFTLHAIEAIKALQEGVRRQAQSAQDQKLQSGILVPKCPIECAEVQISSIVEKIVTASRNDQKEKEQYVIDIARKGVFPGGVDPFQSTWTAWGVKFSDRTKIHELIAGILAYLLDVRDPSSIRPLAEEHDPS